MINLRYLLYLQVEKERNRQLDVKVWSSRKSWEREREMCELSVYRWDIVSEIRSPRK